MTMPQLPALGSKDWYAWAQAAHAAATEVTSGRLTAAELAAASVAAVEAATTVAPAGAWDFAQTPTVAGVPVGSGGGVATDAELRDRSTHTGTQTAATISDLREQVEDYVAALLGAGTNVTLTYTDNGEGAGSLTIAATGGTTDPEAVRDAIGVALVGAGLISVAVNDAGDTITISTTATANSTDAQLRDRSTHTGSQAISTVTGLQAALDGKANLTVAANTQTGTAYTLVLADAGKAVEMNNAAANTLTIPPNSSVALPIGTIIEVFQLGAGQTTVAAGAGVTLRAPDGAKLAKQYASGSLRKRGTDEWVLAGNVTT